MMHGPINVRFTKCIYRHTYDTSEHPSESYRGYFEEVKIDGMAIMRNLFFYLMKVTCNNVQHDVTDRGRNH